MHCFILFCCTEKCDKQATVVSQLLTTLPMGVGKIFLKSKLQSLVISSREKYPYFWRYPNFLKHGVGKTEESVCANNYQNTFTPFDTQSQCHLWFLRYARDRQTDKHSDRTSQYSTFLFRELTNVTTGRKRGHQRQRWSLWNKRRC